MNPQVAAMLLGGVPLLLGLGFWRYLRSIAPLSGLRFLSVVLLGLIAGGTCHWLELRFWALTGLSPTTTRGHALSAILATFLFAVPLEEAGKVFAIWPFYLRHRLQNRYYGLLYGVMVGSGFAAAESALEVMADPSALTLLRVASGSIGQLFAAGTWGYVLGHRARGRWFALSWLGATLIRGFYDHVVFGRGPGLMVLAVPMALAMLALGWSALRDSEAYDLEYGSGRASLDRFGGLGAAIALAEPPPLKTIRRVLRRSSQPLMLHWIVIGAFVTTGAVLVCLGAGVLLGHRMGIDFSLANEADVRSSGPLVLLGVSVLAAFPIAGYLVARASGATTVLEPAMGVALSIGIATALFVVAEPVAVIFSLALAPVAFGLACAGAWFGLRSH